MTRRVLVLGKNGQLGQSLQKVAAQYPLFELDFAGRDRRDLESAESISTFFDRLEQPYAGIINAAAYTAVDRAESEQELARQVNQHAVAQLAGIARQQGSYFLHVSTDYVFSGQACRPYTEADPTAPVNAYGASKLGGEQALLASGCRGGIVRTGWVYSEFGNNFVKTMLRLGGQRRELGVVCDQVGTPTYAPDLAAALLELLKAGLDSAASDAQVYHYSNEGVCSWYDFAVAVFELSGVACAVSPIASSAYPTPAARPFYSVLSKARIRQLLSAPIPHWRQSLGLCLLGLQEHVNS